MNPIEARARQLGLVFGTWQVREILAHANQASGATFSLAQDGLQGEETCQMHAVCLVQKQGRWHTMPIQERQAIEQEVQPRIQQALQALMQKKLLPDGKRVPGYLEHSLQFWTDMDGFGWDLLVRVDPKTTVAPAPTPPVIPAYTTEVEDPLFDMFLQTDTAAPRKSRKKTSWALIFAFLALVVVVAMLFFLLGQQLSNSGDDQPDRVSDGASSGTAGSQSPNSGAENGTSGQLSPVTTTAPTPKPTPAPTIAPGQQLLADAERLAQAGEYRQAIAKLWGGSHLLEKDVLYQVAGDYMLQLHTGSKLALGREHTVRLYDNGHVYSIGNNEWNQHSANQWQNIAAIGCGDFHTVGLKTNGTVVAVGKNLEEQCNVSTWQNVEYLFVGDYTTVGLTYDRKILITGWDNKGQCNINSLYRSDMPIAGIAAGYEHTVVLYADGTVAGVGDDKYGQLSGLSSWHDIVAVYAGTYHTVGLKADGTVVACGQQSKGACDVSGWINVKQISVGDYHTVALLENGTVVATGDTSNDRCEVSSWRNVAEVCAGGRHTVAICANGTLVATGKNNHGQINVDMLD